jgi:hypothetical protein
MRAWSEGLGKTELVFELHNCEYISNSNELVIYGKTVRPVVWKLRVTVEEGDIRMLLPLVFSKAALKFAYSRLCALIGSIRKVRGRVT